MLWCVLGEDVDNGGTWFDLMNRKDSCYSPLSIAATPNKQGDLSTECTAFLLLFFPSPVITSYAWEITVHCVISSHGLSSTFNTLLCVGLLPGGACYVDLFHFAGGVFLILTCSFKWTLEQNNVLTVKRDLDGKSTRFAVLLCDSRSGHIMLMSCHVM